MAQIKVGPSMKTPKGIHVFRSGAWQLLKSANVFRNGVLNRVWSATLPNLIDTSKLLTRIPEADTSAVEILDETPEYYLIKAVNWSAVGFAIAWGGNPRSCLFDIPIEIVSSTYSEPGMQASLYDGSFYNYTYSSSVKDIGVKTSIVGDGYSSSATQIHVFNESAQRTDAEGEVVFKLYKSAEVILDL